MIFFAYFFMMFPIFSLIIIPANCIMAGVEAHGTEQDVKPLILQYSKYGLMIAVGVSAFLSAIVWLAKVWVPSVKLFFGV